MRTPVRGTQSELRRSDFHPRTPVRGTKSEFHSWTSIRRRSPTSTNAPSALGFHDWPAVSSPVRRFPNPFGSGGAGKRYRWPVTHVNSRRDATRVRRVIPSQNLQKQSTETESINVRDPDLTDSYTGLSLITAYKRYHNHRIE